jgi:putative ABC transport system substrate-binding protein
VGVLEANSAAVGAQRLDALQQGLRDMGYIQGQNFSLETRYADGKVDHIPTLAAELVNSMIDILVVSSTPKALAAKKATKTIPIVFFGVSAPMKAPH